LDSAVPRTPSLYPLSLHDALPILGSEEFVAAIAYREGESDGETLAERLREAFDAPVQVQPFVLDVTLSIGIALYPDHAHDAAALDRKSTRLHSSHVKISYAVFCLK